MAKSKKTAETKRKQSKEIAKVPPEAEAQTAPEPEARLDTADAQVDDGSDAPADAIQVSAADAHAEAHVPAADAQVGPSPHEVPAVPAKSHGRRKPVEASPKEPAAGRLSGLDAAAQVLKEAGVPMRCKDLVQAMLEKGLWSTGGKTPAATLYSAILREITVKGDKSRFRKSDRGLFSLAAPNA